MRLSYAGEPGWEIYTETGYGLKLWDLLWEAGQAAGIAALGAGAFDSLRLEKGYRLRGSDIHTEYDPFEAGLGWTVKLDKGKLPRPGRPAGAARAGPRTQAFLHDPRRPGGGGPREGADPRRGAGAGIGHQQQPRLHRREKQIAYGYLPVRNAAQGTGVEIEYFGERLAATVAAEPLLPPTRGAAS